MSNRCIHHICLWAVMTSLSSCAYMQTHKNIEEMGKLHTGYHLQSPLKLYRAGGEYYLAAEEQQLSIQYPVIHDTIFLNENNAPQLSPVEQENKQVFFRISDGTGDVMQRQDGYVEIDTLKTEIQDSSASGCCATLPAGAQACSVRAAVQGNPITWLADTEPAANSVGTTILSAVDHVLIDWPGTILYNAAIPIMAPFVFFHQFLTED